MDNCGRIFFSGWGGESNFLGNTYGLNVTNDAFESKTDGSDFYIAVFARDMQSLLYGTYYGGKQSWEHVDGGTSRFDKNSVIYQSVCAGCGGFSDLPTTPSNVWSHKNKGTRPSGRPTGCNNALLKIDLDVSDLEAGMKIPDERCIKDSVQYKDTSLYANNYIWHFGDGDTSNDQTPVHQYDTAGSYLVTLVAINQFSCQFKDTVRDTIQIYKSPKPDMVIDTGNCSWSRTFTYSGEHGGNFTWHFGDSSSPKGGQQVTRGYQDTGTYFVTCIVDSGKACSDTTVDTVYINQVSRPDFSFSIDTCQGRVTYFNESRNSNNYRWRWGDGNDTAITGKDTIAHTYTESDTFNVRLITDTSRYCKDVIEKDIILKSPDGSFNYQITDSCQFQVQFINQSKFADSLIWYFNGDTVNSQKDTLNYQFEGPGRYPIKLWVRGLRGICMDTIQKSILLDTLPKAGYSFKTKNCSSFIEVQTDSANTSALKWQVNEKNGRYDSIFRSLPNNKFFLPEPRTDYEVKQVAIPGSQCSDTASRNVSLDSAAFADFDYELDTCQRLVTFINNSTQGVKYKWDFGDNTSNQVYEPVHQFNSSAIFQVQLTVTDRGCVDSQFTGVQIPIKPEAQFTIRQKICQNEVTFDNQSRFADEVLWDFGDGSSKVKADTPIFHHTYDDTGTYQVQMIVTRKDKCPDTLTKPLKIDSFAHAGFTFQKPNCSDTVQFKPQLDSIGRFQWHFGNGSTSDRHSPLNVYQTMDTFPVKLVHQMEGCRDTAYDTVLNLMPEADFVFEKDSCSPLVRFNNRSRFAGNYNWFFGNGDSSKKRSPTYEYSDTGAYQVQLKVSQNQSCEDSLRKSLAIKEFIKGGFDFEQDPCEQKGVFQPQTKLTDSIAWQGLPKDWVDIKHDSFTYVFDTPGYHEVGFKVFNQQCRDSFSKTLFIDSSVNADFTVKNPECLAWVKLRDQSDKADRYFWQFGDGNSSNKQNPEHFYDNNGEYSITLIINPQKVCPDTMTKTITMEGAATSSEFEIPNTFTPNEDGINDYFTIGGVTGCQSFEVIIFNRWGQPVYQKEGKGRFRWDGNDQDNGNPLPNGTYYYRVRADNFKKTGTVTLIRND